MAKIKVIGIDLAKNVFQLCGMTRNQKIEFNKTLKRDQLADFLVQQERTLVAMEACYSSHYWARTIEAMGHTVVLLPAQFVKPFVRGNKSDRNDAVAIAEAALRPNIRPVPMKSLEQQDVQVLHRLRERYVTRRTGLINQARGLLSEYGIIAPTGLKAFYSLLTEVAAPGSKHLSEWLRPEFAQMIDEYCWLTDRIDELNAKLSQLAKTHDGVQDPVEPARHRHHQRDCLVQRHRTGPALQFRPRAGYLDWTDTAPIEQRRQIATAAASPSAATATFANS